MTRDISPSPAAIRAAKKIIGQEPSDYICPTSATAGIALQIAKIIDAETGLPELLAALTAIRDARDELGADRCFHDWVVEFARDTLAMLESSLTGAGATEMPPESSASSEVL